MEIRWLEDFIALAKTRHFSRAADEQNVTQPTFSRRIKLLEEEMKVTLIDRNTLPLSLTPAGEIFLQSAELITRQLRDTKARCLEIKEQEQSQIRFVTTQSLFLGYYRELVAPLC
ncbi:MAG: LysR family transcriptional regulator, partial [Marinomonas sp.]